MADPAGPHLTLTVFILTANSPVNIQLLKLFREYIIV
jgi:hypothetical protein